MKWISQTYPTDGVGVNPIRIQSNVNPMRIQCTAVQWNIFRWFASIDGADLNPTADWMAPVSMEAEAVHYEGSLNKDWPFINSSIAASDWREENIDRS